MKRLSKLIASAAVVGSLGLLLSTSASAGGSYGFSFGYNSGGCAPRYYGGVNYSYSYWGAPTYYYRPAPVYYCAPPPVYYSPPVVTYRPCGAQPMFYYYGASYIRY